MTTTQTTRPTPEAVMCAADEIPPDDCDDFPACGHPPVTVVGNEYHGYDTVDRGGHFTTPLARICDDDGELTVYRFEDGVMEWSATFRHAPVEVVAAVWKAARS